MAFLSEKKLLPGDQNKTEKVLEATCDPRLAKGLSSFQALSSAPGPIVYFLLGSVATIGQKDYK